MSLRLHEAGDPAGRPVVYLHGSGSSRLEADVYDMDARDLGIRLLAWDRPGSGRRPPAPGRSILDVVADTEAALTSLGMDRAPVIGLSGGGVHALALACTAPHLVSQAVLVNPGAPSHPSLNKLLPMRMRWTVRAARSPWLLRQLGKPMEALGKDMAKTLSSPTKARMVDPTDLQVLRDPDVLTPFGAAAREGSRQPGAWATEALMFWGGSWPFEPTALKAPVHVFSGADDPYRAFAEQLREAGAQLTSISGGHLAGLAPSARPQILKAAVGS